jgi:hypothetical protein
LHVLYATSSSSTKCLTQLRGQMRLISTLSLYPPTQTGCCQIGSKAALFRLCRETILIDRTVLSSLCEPAQSTHLISLKVRLAKHAQITNCCVLLAYRHLGNAYLIWQLYLKSPRNFGFGRQNCRLSHFLTPLIYHLCESGSCFNVALD